MVGVVSDTGGVGHDVWDVVLLVHPVEKMSHWTAGEDGHVLSSVCLVRQWDDGLLAERRIGWEREKLVNQQILMPRQLLGSPRNEQTLS